MGVFFDDDELRLFPWILVGFCLLNVNGGFNLGVGFQILEMDENGIFMRNMICFLCGPPNPLCFSVYIHPLPLVSMISTFTE